VNDGPAGLESERTSSATIAGDSGGSVESVSNPLATRPAPQAAPRAVINLLAHEWPLLIALACFALAAVIVPTMTRIATTDDWAYTRSVEHLYWDSKLVVFPVVAASAIGQIFWGGLFALIFGMSLGVMRLSTVVMVALGGVALYALLRQLGVSRSRSLLGTMVYLFNPLTFVLAFTFMTDPHFTSVMLIAVALHVRGLRPDDERAWAVLLASLVAGFAFWIRQQGAFIPLAVVLALLVTRRLTPDMRGLLRLTPIVVPATLMALAYAIWLRWFNDVPAVQQGFLDEAQRAGWSGTWQLAQHLTYIEFAYLGALLLPLLLGIVPVMRTWAVRPVALSATGWWLFLAWIALAVGGLYFFTRAGRRMPYIGQFVGTSGLGSPDLIGKRPRLFENGGVFDALTIVSVLAGIALGYLLLRHVPTAATPERAGAGIVAMVALWQIVGVLPPSYHYLRRGDSLDRYLLPLVPLAIALLLWAVRDLRLLQPLAWLAVAAFMVISVAGTRDYLVYMETIWQVAREANASGVPNTELDAGSGWDGYHLYEQMLDQHITKARSPRGSPWWVYFYAKPTDSSYIVAASPSVPGYFVVRRQRYNQWLQRDPVYIYLLARYGRVFPRG
jgi:4-amino-4-deoxy-L-arabinose transferase-like glycosyltransferase